MSGESVCPICGTGLQPTPDGGEVCPQCFLQRIAGAPGGRVSTAAEPAAGAVDVDGDGLERYRLLDPIGEGGMGAVYRARQLEPVRRDVAIKFIKWGMDTRQVVARFEAERQALAMMDHPAIAKVLDGGATRSGRPFFVMELVSGEPINQFCDSRRLTLPERLELFTKVCAGVQHAHHKGIVHRDLKPSNILVSGADGELRPKIIDFGIAKAMGPRLSDVTFHTRLGLPIGSPLYMSPEQAEFGGVDVDTRTDVYALGVILYELLVGAPPLEPDPDSTGLDEFLRRLRETDPPRPSARITAFGERLPEIARQRRLEPRLLRRQLQGDLDWIVLKAIEKDRARRYDSPAELAADVRRHLQDLPVSAGPPGFGYRAGKFFRRHRLAVSAAVVLTLMAVGATVATAVGLIRARRAEAVAASQAARAEAINAFMQDTLGAADPYLRLGIDVTVLEALEDAVQRIPSSFADQPEVRAAVEQTIGGTYQKLGRFEEAQSLLEEALATRRLSLGDRHPDTLDVMGQLGALYRTEGKLDRAGELLEESLVGWRALYDEPHPRIAEALYRLAWVETDRSDFAAADRLFQQALDMRLTLQPGDSEETAEASAGMAASLGNRGEYARAEPLFRQALEMRRRLYGERHLNVAKTESSLALQLRAVGRVEEAEGLMRSSLETRQALLGDEHPEVLESLNGLATVLYSQGRSQAAEAIYRDLLPRYRGLLGDHLLVGRTLVNLAAALGDLGDWEGGVAALREAVEVNTRAVGPRHVVVGLSLQNLATHLGKQGRHQEAERAARAALSILEESLTAEHWRTSVARGVLAQALVASGQFEEAEAELRRSLAPIEAAHGTGSQVYRAALDRLLELYRAWGRPDDAAEIERRLAAADA